MSSGPPSLLRRVLIAPALSVALLAAAATTSAPLGAEATASALPQTQRIVDAACALPHEVLLRMWRGYREDRSGDVMIVAPEFSFVDGGISHSSPWPYTQDVPMFWYGPGHVKPAGELTRPVTSADIAPTIGQLLDYEFPAPDGKPMAEALIPKSQRTDPPRLVIPIVWDAAGLESVLNQWPDDWPYLRSLIPQGAWFSNATVGSAPSVTPPIHTNMGTGAFPDHHGMMDNQNRIGGEVTDTWGRSAGSMIMPTIGDLYDLSRGNKPLVGAIASIPPHLGMLGHGLLWGGGDKDIAVLRASLSDEGAEGDTWNLPQKHGRFFDFPGYINKLPGLITYQDYADRADGSEDGLWRGHPIESQDDLFDSPARLPYQTDAIEEVIRTEGFGKDEVPDLLWVNYKLIDEVEHHYFSTGPEMGDALRSQDEVLRELISFLDEEVGEGEWVLLVTADHGSTPDPLVSGGFRIKVATMETNLDATFGDGVTDKVRPTQIYLHVDELEKNGFDLNDVSEYLLDYTKEDSQAAGQDIPDDELDDPVFLAAFPGELMAELPCLPEARE